MRRHIVIAGVLLLAGAVVNVAVAWACAYFVAYPSSGLMITVRVDADRAMRYYVLRAFASEFAVKGDPTEISFGTVQIWPESACPRRSYGLLGCP